MFDEEYERVIHPRRVGDIYLYTVRPGDNVYRIARNFNTKIEWIACMNKLDQQMMIYPDQQLYSFHSSRTNANGTIKRFL